MRPAASRNRSAILVVLRVLAATWVVCMLSCWPGHVQAAEPEIADVVVQPSEGEQKKPSPWLLVPVFNSSPKLGITLGATGAYLHQFDPKSRPSIFGVTGQYTNTESIVGGAFARTSFDEDRQRLNAGLAYGNIKNDYNDYLGTGVPLRNNAGLKSFISRYLHRAYGDWFVGVQAIYQNFAIAGDTAFDDLVLDILGVAPSKSGGLGLVAYYDTRDNEFKPGKGWVLSLNNLAYRESLGGDQNFDVYRVDIRHYIPFGDGNIFAFRQLNHLTSDAPTASLAPVQLRGYKIGQYSSDYMSQIEGEFRLRLADRWTTTIFAGVACTYGSGKNCSDSANLFPAAGAGVQYILKPAIGIVLNLEYAHGKDGNYGVYLKTGYAF
jgi:outer membrane protein assembly factor BamA